MWFKKKSEKIFMISAFRIFYYMYSLKLYFCITSLYDFKYVSNSPSVDWIAIIDNRINSAGIADLIRMANLSYPLPVKGFQKTGVQPYI